MDAVSGSLLSDHIERGTVRGGSLLVFAVPAKEKHELYRLYSFFEKVRLRSVRSLFYRMNKSAVGFIRKCFFFRGRFCMLSSPTRPPRPKRLRIDHDSALRSARVTLFYAARRALVKGITRHLGPSPSQWGFGWTV